MQDYTEYKNVRKTVKNQEMNEKKNDLGKFGNKIEQDSKYIQQFYETIKKKKKRK